MNDAQYRYLQQLEPGISREVGRLLIERCKKADRDQRCSIRNLLRLIVKISVGAFRGSDMSVSISRRGPDENLVMLSRFRPKYVPKDRA